MLTSFSATPARKFENPCRKCWNLQYFRKNIGDLNTPYTIFLILIRDLKSAIKVSKRGDLQSIFLTRRYLEIYHRTWLMLDAHLFLQSQLVLHRAYSFNEEELFFWPHFLRYREYCFYYEYKDKSWRDIINIHTCSYKAVVFNIFVRIPPHIIYLQLCTSKVVGA